MWTTIWFFVIGENGDKSNAIVKFISTNIDYFEGRINKNKDKKIFFEIT